MVTQHQIDVAEKVLLDLRQRFIEQNEPIPPVVLKLRLTGIEDKLNNIFCLLQELFPEESKKYHIVQDIPF